MYQSQSSHTYIPIDEDSDVPSSFPSWFRRHTFKLSVSMMIVGFICLTLSYQSIHSTSPATSEPTTLIGYTLAQHSKSPSKPEDVEPFEKFVADNRDICHSPNYTKTTLKTAKEYSMIALFEDTHGLNKFEASGIIHRNNYFYVVYDNLYEIGRIQRDLPFNSPHNVLVKDTTRSGDSGYESLIWDERTDQFYAIVEAVQRTEETYHSMIEEFIMDDSKNTYSLIRRCRADFLFNNGNKGFEGALGIWRNDVYYILGLCEGNYCKGGEEGRQAGNGRIVLLQQTKHNNSACVWETQQLINLPNEIQFVDYSAISSYPTKNSNIYRIAITSQETSQVWIGTLDISSWTFGNGKLYDFPRNDNCQVVYCNIEGVHWLDDQILIAVSDKMKSGGRQDFRCLEKDQSVHLFVIP